MKLKEDDEKNQKHENNNESVQKVREHEEMERNDDVIDAAPLRSLPYTFRPLLFVPSSSS